MAVVLLPAASEQSVSHTLLPASQPLAMPLRFRNGAISVDGEAHGEGTRRSKAPKATSNIPVRVQHGHGQA